MTRSPKTPQQKKRPSPPKKKAAVHRAERRIAHQALAATLAHKDLEIADAAESRLKRERLQRGGKRSAAGAAPVVERKRQRRAVLVGRRKKARPAR